MTCKKTSSTVSDMQICRVMRFKKVVLGGVVLVWLLMGGLAFAEQMNVVSETGSHDEDVLDSLQLAVKSEQIEDHAGPIPTNPFQPTIEVDPVPCVFSPLRIDTSRPLLRSKNTFSLFLIVSCYRI